MINLGLNRTQRLLDYIAKDILKQPSFNPHWKAIHIAGTNGKGSVAAYLAACLRLALRKHGCDNQRIGRFTSPHFIDRWDCIQINNEPVSQKLFEDTERQVRTLAWQVAQDLEKESTKDCHDLGAQDEERIKRDSKPTEFEILTATAFALFSSVQNEVEFAVIECGLGGRLDATNTLPDSAIATSIITRIGLDHVDMLGGSLESIVREKCGIFRHDVPIVYDGQNEENVVRMILREVPFKYGLGSSSSPRMPDSSKDLVRGVVINEPEQLATQKHTATSSKSQPPEVSDGGRIADIKQSHTGTPSMLLKMMQHQLTNLGVALAAAETAVRARQEEGFSMTPCSPDLIERCISDADRSYPARLQELDPGWLQNCPSHLFKELNRCRILLDGAHNAQSAGVLRQYIEERIGATKSVSDTTSRQARNSGLGRNQRSVIFVMGLSRGGDKNKVFETIFSQPPIDDFRIFGTGFGPVQGMPWVKPRGQSELEDTFSSLNFPDKAEYSSENIVETLEEVDKFVTRTYVDNEREIPLIVIAGSLYLASDFLRFLRDGRTEYLRWLSDR